MKNLYLCSIALFALIFQSCESDAPDTVSDSARVAPVSGHSLRINNQSELQLSGEIVCYGAENNLTANSQIRITGKFSMPANAEATHKNFVQASSPEFRINPWYVSYNQGPSFAYPAAQTNSTFGQYIAPGVSPVKFANWRYLKVRFSYNEIPGFEPVTMVIELPQYSANNSGSQVVDLSQYGLQEDLQITQTSFQTANGNTVVTLDSALINQ